MDPVSLAFIAVWISFLSVFANTRSVDTVTYTIIASGRTILLTVSSIRSSNTCLNKFPLLILGSLCFPISSVSILFLFYESSTFCNDEFPRNKFFNNWWKECKMILYICGIKRVYFLLNVDFNRQIRSNTVQQVFSKRYMY